MITISPADQTEWIHFYKTRLQRDSCFLEHHHLAWTSYRPISLTIHAPPKYKPSKGPAKSICVNGSVEGVSTAAPTTAPTTTYLQIESIWSLETNPSCPSKSWITGTWNGIAWRMYKCQHMVLYEILQLSHFTLPLYLYNKIRFVVL
jgi:hypothetical protein